MVMCGRFKALLCGAAFSSGLVIGGSAVAAPQTANKAAPDFVITAVGDAMIMKPIVGDMANPRFLGVVSAIKEGDAAFANLEEIYPSENAYPAAMAPNTYLAAPPSVLKDLKSMGLNIFGASNNHAYDYGLEGLLDSIAAMRAADVTFAGMGKTLGEARAPAYLDTGRGRVALISTVSSINEMATAGDPRPDMRGRPGVSPLHFNTTLKVDKATFDILTALKGRPGIVDPFGPQTTGQAGIWGAQLPHKPGENTVTVAGRTYELSDKPGVYTSPNPEDLASIVHSIKDAKARAEYVLVSIHTHESGAGGNTTPPQFLEEFARAAIDAGADEFLGHGPILLRGIEIYKGKPIFYSLGGLFWQADLVAVQPSAYYTRFALGPDARPSDGLGTRGMEGAPEMYESVVARVNYTNGQPTEVVLTPFKKRTKAQAGWPRYGVPELADAATGAKILADLQRMSRPYGTVITIRDGKGYIALPGGGEPAKAGPSAH